ncbi:YCII-related protein [Penicillium coprophilum]|uniref:YCII-related protein n=1 Tax=Penicillium coprophilum TaxID=36646 RepID=UPI002391CF69|nr:YCII-related protein [Penicillium coprophilum]KAJ5164290.1 YCII-related protein [Penicillium coprophilum]
MAARKEFLCILPDNANVLAIRRKVKRVHYDGIKPLIAAGKLVDGGAIFEEHPEEGKDALFKGSVIVYSAKNAEEVRAILEKDIYATSGVWDLSKAQILPISDIYEKQHM